MEKKILTIQQNKGTLQKLEFLFQNQGLTLKIVSRNKEKWGRLIKEAALVILEIGMQEGKTGELESLRLVKTLRAMTDKPVLIYGQKLDEMAVIALLNAGADDCVTASCSPLEFLARVNAQMRRYVRLKDTQYPLNVVKIGDLEIDDTAKTVQIEGRNVSMTPMEYKILYLLATKRGRVLSTTQIYEQVWHMKPIGADNTVAVHVRHIREKIERNPQNPQYLQVVWGQGYKVG